MSTRPRRRRRRKPGVFMSVVVPVLNGAETLPATLASLDAQTLDPTSYEVIIVDDGSTDGTPELVKAFADVARAPVRLVEIPHGGPAAARNAGIAESIGQYVAFTDADVEVARDWLRRAADRLDADHDLAGVEGRTIPKGEVGTLTHQMRNETGGHYMTCNIVYRKVVLDAAGGFDERYKLAFLEDSDLAFTVMSLGGEIVFDPDVLAHHLVLYHGRRKFWRDVAKRRFLPLIMRKHPDLYRSHLRRFVPAYPPIYVEQMLALAATVAAAITRAWAPLVPAALLLLLTLRRVAHALRARDPLSFIQAVIVPFLQAFWIFIGYVKFRKAKRFRRA